MKLDEKHRQQVTLKYLAGILTLLMIGLMPVDVYSIIQSSEIVQSEESDSSYIRELPERYGFAFSGDGTTGGEGGQEVTVTTAEQLLKFATSDDPYIINVVDTVEIVRGIGNYTETNGEYHLGSNTTLRGIGKNATILYGGFRISEVRNVIIQNLHFDGTFNGYNPAFENIDCSDVPEGEHRYKNGSCLQPGDKGPTDNAIEVTEGSENVWITQNTFKRYSDEIMSVKRAASLVTISWNRFDDLIAGKEGMMILIGSSDSHFFDSGRLKTTLHHNYFASRSRQPRTRFGQFHIFNNYFHNVGSYATASTMDAEILVENNFYENVNNAWHIGFGNSREGYLFARNNIFVNTDRPATRGALGVDVFDPSEEFIYPYSLDDPEDVPELVLENAGAGTGFFLNSLQPYPGAVDLFFPVAEGSVTLQPHFEWSETVFADSYQFELSTGIQEPAFFETTLNDTSFTYPGELEGNTTYFWRVRALNDTGEGPWSDFEYFITRISTSGEGIESEVPGNFVLNQNYPNPFNPSTNISYELPETAHVDIKIYDMTGRVVSELVNDLQQAGRHSVEFNSRDLASGIYKYRLIASPANNMNNQFVNFRIMTLIK